MRCPVWDNGLFVESGPPKLSNRVPTIWRRDRVTPPLHTLMFPLISEPRVFLRVVVITKLCAARWANLEARTAVLVVCGILQFVIAADWAAKSDSIGH